MRLAIPCCEFAMLNHPVAGAVCQGVRRGSRVGGWQQPQRAGVLHGLHAYLMGAILQVIFLIQCCCRR
jgi:hypothetical protein